MELRLMKALMIKTLAAISILSLVFSIFGSIAAFALPSSMVGIYFTSIIIPALMPLGIIAFPAFGLLWPLAVSILALGIALGIAYAIRKYNQPAQNSLPAIARKNTSKDSFVDVDISQDMPITPEQKQNIFGMLDERDKILTTWRRYSPMHIVKLSYINKSLGSFEDEARKYKKKKSP